MIMANKSHISLPRAIMLLMVLVFLLAACEPLQPNAKPILIETFQDAQAIFREIRSATPREAQARADELWQSLVDSHRVPLILGTQVIFLYKGEVKQVHWSGSFNGWLTPGLEGVQLGQSNLWVAYLELPEASRIEYKIILNAKDWIVDPVNQDTTFSGLTGVNNVLTVAGFSVTDESTKRSDVKQGTLTQQTYPNPEQVDRAIRTWAPHFETSPLGRDNGP